MLIRNPSEEIYRYMGQENKYGLGIVPIFSNLIENSRTYWFREWTSDLKCLFRFLIDKITITVDPKMINLESFNKINRLDSVNTKLLRNGYGQIFIHERALDPTLSVKDSIFLVILRFFWFGVFLISVEDLINTLFILVTIQVIHYL